MRIGFLARLWLTLVAVVHLEVARRHGAAHISLTVVLSEFQQLFVYAVIVGGPIVATVGFWTRYFVVSVWLFCSCMTGALLFGVFYHYVLISADNVSCLPLGSVSAHLEFTRTALLLALLESCGVLSGTAFLIRSRRAGAPFLHQA